MSEVKQYPETWDEVDQEQASKSTYLKLKDGETVRLKFLNGPLVFRELYQDVGEKDRQGKAKKTRFVIPFTSQVPGYKFKAQWLAEVIILDGAAKGQHKLWQFGSTVSEQLQGIAKEWGTVKEPLIAFSRKGSGQMDTEYRVTAGKPDGNAYFPELDLASELKMSPAEKLSKLPPPTAKADESTMQGTRISTPQYDLICGLAEKGRLSHSDVLKIAERKFNKHDLDSLSMKEASEVIDVLKEMVGAS